MIGLLWLAACAVAAGMCIAAWRRQHARVWLVLAVVLLTLGASRVLGWQRSVTQLGRDAARAEGWYQDRHATQLALIVACAITAVMAAFIVMWRGRHWTRSQRVAVVMTLLLVCLTGVRMASLHQADRVLTAGVGPLRLGRAVEAAGLFLIAVAAAGVKRSAQPGR